MRQLDALLIERMIWQGRATNVSVKWSDMPRGQGEDSLQSAVEAIAEVDEKIKTMVEEVIARREMIERACDDLSDKRMQEVIKKRYLLGMTIEEVAETMAYSVAQVNRYHAAALEEIFFDQNDME